MDKSGQERMPEPPRKLFAQWLGLWATDILLISGGALVAAGVAMIYPPAGMIAAGVFLIVGGVLLAKGGSGP